MEYSDFNITVVGLGLIGGSYAAALKNMDFKNLWGIDIDDITTHNAEEMGIIDNGYTDPSIPLGKSDIVIIALYPNLTKKFVKDNLHNFKPGAIITDTAGIKSKIVNEINKILPKNLDFIGGHPMAGRESNGLEFSSKDLFEGANYIITPVEKNMPRNLDIIEDIARRIGCKNVIRVTPEQHDEIISFTSHLPHIIAVSLINSGVLDMQTYLFTGGSFKDATRVADINSDLWVELLTSNKDNIVSSLEEFENNIHALKKALIDDDKNYLNCELQKARFRRREIKYEYVDSKHSR